MLAAVLEAINTCSSLPHQAGASIPGRAAPTGMRLHTEHTLLMARCSSALLPFLRGVLGCCHYFSESPKEDALSCVSDACLGIQ